MKIIMKIRRYNPEKSADFYFQDFEVPVKETDRVLDALVYIKTYIDGTLGFRKSCAHGVCGSDAMIINGTARLACKTLVKEVVSEDSSVITVGPLNCMPVQYDLMIDQERFFKNYRSVLPYLINEEPVKEKERIQNPKDRAAYDDPTKCILCSACYSACPVIDEKNKDFIGPAACVQAARFIFDNRDKGFEKRCKILDDSNGVWACENHFNCTRVCPRGIKVTKNINLIKRKIDKWKKNNETV